MGQIKKAGNLGRRFFVSWHQAPRCIAALATCSCALPQLNCQLRRLLLPPHSSISQGVGGGTYSRGGVFLKFWLVGGALIPRGHLFERRCLFKDLLFDLNNSTKQSVDYEQN